MPTATFASSTQMKTGSRLSQISGLSSNVWDPIKSGFANRLPERYAHTNSTLILDHSAAVRAASNSHDLTRMAIARFWFVAKWMTFPQAVKQVGLLALRGDGKKAHRRN